MCFSPKISTPKPSTAAPEPAPLSEEVASVDIGAEEVRTPTRPRVSKT
ncbi:hypothetical protein [Enterobacter phage 04_vB_Eclo_IJM]|nr:hypothetical protein [Enterobacter phage 04_vB_Eclo_IJM]